MTITASVHVTVYIRLTVVLKKIRKSWGRRETTASSKSHVSIGRWQHGDFVKAI